MNKLRADCNVQIRIPARAEEGKVADTAFKVIGYEEDCEKARVAILEIVSHLVSVYSLIVVVNIFAFLRRSFKVKFFLLLFYQLSVDPDQLSCNIVYSAAGTPLGTGITLNSSLGLQSYK